jgi:hypothetical protein
MCIFVEQLAAGMVVDAIIKRELRRSPDGQVYPKVRLQAIWTGAILVPVSMLYTTDLLCLLTSHAMVKAGLLIYGFCIANAGVHWSGALVGMGIACFGIQVITVRLSPA